MVRARSQVYPTKVGQNDNNLHSPGHGRLPHLKRNTNAPTGGAALHQDEHGGEADRGRRGRRRGGRQR